MLLKDRIAIVTGGARGIGAAIAARFRAEGATVVVADVAGDADYIECDVSKKTDVEHWSRKY